MSDDELAKVGLFAPINRSILKDLGFVCVLESVSSDYLNMPSVQKAIHVQQANVTSWGPCGNSDASSYSRELVQQHRDNMRHMGMLEPNNDLGDLYKKLIKQIPVLIYSGDVDQCVPYYYSDGWVRRLGWAVKDDWKTWTYGSGESEFVGGWVTTFDEPNGLTFLTVKDGQTIPLTHSHRDQLYGSTWVLFSERSLTRSFAVSLLFAAVQLAIWYPNTRLRLL